MPSLVCSEILFSFLLADALDDLDKTRGPSLGVGVAEYILWRIPTERGSCQDQCGVGDDADAVKWRTTIPALKERRRLGFVYHGLIKQHEECTRRRGDVSHVVLVVVAVRSSLDVWSCEFQSTKSGEPHGRCVSPLPSVSLAEVGPSSWRRSLGEELYAAKLVLVGMMLLHLVPFTARGLCLVSSHGVKRSVQGFSGWGWILSVGLLSFSVCVLSYRELWS